jgi:hypothetical protein
MRDIRPLFAGTVPTMQHECGALARVSRSKQVSPTRYQVQKTTLQAMKTPTMTAMTITAISHGGRPPPSPLLGGPGMGVAEGVPCAGGAGTAVPLVVTGAFAGEKDTGVFCKSKKEVSCMQVATAFVG